MSALVLAHQGGWDEILLILTPVGLFAGLLYLANKRANAELDQRRAEAAEEPQAATAEGPDPAPPTEDDA